MKTNVFFTCSFIFSLILFSCAPDKQQTLFKLLDAKETGIVFSNNLTFDKDFNIYTYRNYYNGGGVAVGDVNNDGLLDIYLTANMLPNKLYLNQGNLKFRDITAEAGVAGTRAWSTGVSMADVNGDGWLDIYVCNSGDIKGDNKQNELFINNGDGTFSEMAEMHGLADRGFSTHAAFFDYDRDGDLDMYLLNNSYTAIGTFNLMQDIRPVRDPVGGDKLFRNDNGFFTDVSEQAGIYGSEIGFGLGITIGDVNGDHWPDIFISNDFFERDYLYINNQDGTFTENLTNAMRSISAASMGADMADINNDLQPDIFVTDMLPEPDQRIKQVTMFESWDKFSYNNKHGYHKQFSRNMLHLNQGDGTFKEIGRMAGVEATDWSWGALIFDADNDGFKDLFVANGIYQDITDLDYLNFIAAEETQRKIIRREGVDYAGLVEPIPVNPVPNYIFKNMGNLQFVNYAHIWGLATPVHSNGSAYADLDNDGDLDLIVNNVNQRAFIYENRLNQAEKQPAYLKVQLTGNAPNLWAIGAKVFVFTPLGHYMQEIVPNRGFQSSVDPRPNFGLGENDRIDSVLVIWPSGKVSGVYHPTINTLLTLKESESTIRPLNLPSTQGRKAYQLLKSEFPFQHQENEFVDFDRDRLTYYMRSTEGPAFDIGDINNDGLEDLYIGGAKGQSAGLFLQKSDGTFIATNEQVLVRHSGSEDVAAVFFDADNDGDLDLYVVSGGNEFGFLSPELADRLYLNDGKGNFSWSSQQAIAANLMPGSCVVPFDLDDDGDLDLFVGTRLQPFQYGLPAPSFIYENDGSGYFTDVTIKVAPQLSTLGMVTDAKKLDVNRDGLMDLIIVGEWMSPTLLLNKKGNLISDPTGMESYKGWWYTIEKVDIDGDGNMDLLLGNHGLNSRVRPSMQYPVTLHVHDFDQNGSIEHIFSRYENGRQVPFALRHELVMQMPSMKKKYLKYENYNNQTLQDIFSEKQLKEAVKSEATWFSTSVAWGKSDGTFEIQALPRDVQVAPVYAFTAISKPDGTTDILLGGNLFGSKPQMGVYDADHGSVVNINPQRSMKVYNYLQSGYVVTGQVRGLVPIRITGRPHVLMIRNDDRPLLFEVL